MNNEISGHRFGRLVVVEMTRVGKDRQLAYVCKCDCGRTKTILRWNLLRGSSKSCGCLNQEKKTSRGHLINTKHGMWKTRTYRAWLSMRHRCQTPSAGNYSRYGGAGVEVCDRWQSFEAFLLDMGECPDGMSLDRFPDCNGNYEPGNCRWATPLQQSANRSVTLRLSLNGETRTTTEWALILGLSASLLRKRHWAGWTDERTLTTPVQTQFSRPQRATLSHCSTTSKGQEMPDSVYVPSIHTNVRATFERIRAEQAKATGATP